MKQVCEKAKNSPLCGNKELYLKLKKISNDRLDSNWFYIMVGISLAESHVGQNYAKDNVGGTCYGRYNWGGAKYNILDDNSRVYSSPKFGGYNTVNRFEDAYGCNLFPFDSVEEYWTSKANGLRYGYKGCLDSKEPIKCVSYSYVGDPNVSESSWVSNVSSLVPALNGL